MTKQEFLRLSVSKGLILQAPYGFKPNGKESTGISRLVYLTGDLYADIENKTFSEEFIPVCRPLSDLTKEIEHNGEKFIPALKLVELEEKYNNWKDTGPYDIRIITKPFGQVLKISKAERWVLYISLDEIERAKYYIVSQLIEWKFDIANLIPKEEAINVNTLNVNPYK